MLTDSVDFIIFVVGYSSYRLYLFEKKKIENFISTYQFFQFNVRVFIITYCFYFIIIIVSVIPIQPVRLSKEIIVYEIEVF
jgi:hypothetical protein